jgi:histidine triad (HIT) family protein
MKTDGNCIFCKIVSGEIPSIRVFEDDATLCFMDINPAQQGHALVIPREHWADVHDIPEDLISAVVRTAKRVAGAVHGALAPDGINLVQCNGQGAAQSVAHFHMHVLPRTLGDDLKLNWGLIPGNMDDIQAVAERIRASF